MLFTYNNLLVVEQNAMRENCYFDEDKDSFWDFSMRSGKMLKHTMCKLKYINRINQNF